MKRIDVGELADQAWCPAAVRDGVRDYLAFLGTAAHIYRPAVPLIVRALEQSGARQVVDLGSGTGGPWRSMLPEIEHALGEPVEVLLTDRTPSPIDAHAPLGERLRIVPEPVDARAVPPDLSGVRTLLACFHHFGPDDARAVLDDAVAYADAVVILEPTRRALSAVLAMLTTPLPALAMTPFMRPARLSRLALTYLLPVIPLAVTFDGIASCLRSYTPTELYELARSVDSIRFRWEAGEIAARRPPFVPLTYLVGVA